MIGEILDPVPNHLQHRRVRDGRSVSHAGHAVNRAAAIKVLPKDFVRDTDGLRRLGGLQTFELTVEMHGLLAWLRAARTRQVSD